MQNAEVRLSIIDITKAFTETFTSKEAELLPPTLKMAYGNLVLATAQDNITSIGLLDYIKSMFMSLSNTQTYEQCGKDKKIGFARVTEPISKKEPIDFTNIKKMFRELSAKESQQTEPKEPKKDSKEKSSDKQLLAIARIHFYFAFVLKSYENLDQQPNFKIPLYDAVTIGINSYIVMNRLEKDLKILPKFSKDDRKNFFKELTNKKANLYDLYKALYTFVVSNLKEDNHYLVSFLYNFCKVAQPIVSEDPTCSAVKGWLLKKPEKEEAKKEKLEKPKEKEEKLKKEKKPNLKDLLTGGAPVFGVFRGEGKKSDKTAKVEPFVSDVHDEQPSTSPSPSSSSSGPSS